MDIKVCKFGGTSMATAKSLRQLKEIILGDEERKFVVVSAPGKRFPADMKVTDMLYVCYAKAKSNEEYKKDLMQIKSRYQEIIDGLNLDFSLDEEFAVIEKNFADHIAPGEGEGVELRHIEDKGFIHAVMVAGTGLRICVAVAKRGKNRFYAYI